MGWRPIAESLAKEFLSLPMFPELAEEQIEYVVRSVREVTKARGHWYRKVLEASPSNRTRREGAGAFLDRVLVYRSENERPIIANAGCRSSP